MARLPAFCLQLQRRVADSLVRTAALRPREHALLLLSGGADSMALLSLLRAANRRLGLGLRFAALHVDYGLRGADSDRDRLIVVRACEEAGLPLHVVQLGGRLTGRDFQARAREVRYATARELAAEHGYDVIVTAHNRDDQAETVMYRLVKYASPRGLAGMRPREDDLVRPLLDVGAAEVREYCRAAGITYGEDVTNAEPRYARNVLRLEVLPRLKTLNPRLAETLAAMAEQAAAEADVLVEATADAAQRVKRPPSADGVVTEIDVSALAAESPGLRALVLHEVVREAMSGDALVQRRLVAALQRLAERTEDAGRVSLGRGLEAVRGRGRLSIRAVAPAHSCAPAAVGHDELAIGSRGATVVFCDRRWRLSLESGAAFDHDRALAGEAFVGLLAPPRRVTLRHPRRGERFAPSSLGRETTVARFLAAARVPADRRPMTVVLDVDGRVAWVSGAPFGQAGRVAQPFCVAHSSALTLHVVQEGT